MNALSKIGAIIVAYNPENDVLNKNIKSIKEHVDRVLIVNNGENDLELKDENVDIIENRENIGIAKALNIGIKDMLSKKYEYVLLLDQDSRIKVTSISEFIKYFDEETKMIVPQVKYLKNEKNENKEWEFVELAITSGTILKINDIIESFKRKEIFNEDFFIDSVDFDFCLELKSLNMKIKKIKNYTLYQRLGEMEEKKFLNFKIYPTNHSKVRRYYIYRNRIYMWKKYFQTEKKYVLKDFIHAINEIGLIILFEEGKKEKLKYIKKGVKAALYGKKGKI